MLWMNLDAWQEWHAETDARRKARMRDAILSGEDKIAHEIVRRIGGHREDYDDLVQAARVGLLKALARFDPTRAGWFTYAALWCRAEVTDAIRRSKGHHFRSNNGDTPRYADVYLEDIAAAEPATELATDGDASDRAILVRECVEILAPTDREALISAAAGVPDADIAFMLGIRASEVSEYLYGLIGCIRCTL